MAKILITGLTASHYAGAYEQNRGNMAILVPMLQTLRRRIPDAELLGHIQLLDSYQRLYHYRSVPHATTSAGGSRIGRVIEYYQALLDLVRSRLWRFLKEKLGWDARFLIGGKRLAPFREADVVLFFNGDIFGDNAAPHRLKRFALDMLISVGLGKPSIEFVGSPGPFVKSSESEFAGQVLDRLTAVITREPLSAEMLRSQGIRTVPILSAACPSFLLEPANAERVGAILEAEGLDLSSRPTIGMNLCAHNFGVSGGRVDPEAVKRWKDVETYAGLIKRLLEHTEAQILLIPHAYCFDRATGKDLQQNDYIVLQRAYELAGGDRHGQRLRFLRGIYSVEELKGVLSRLELYIAGRMHSGVGALSSCVPTVLLAYGHKQFGIAKLLRHEKYVNKGHNEEALWNLVMDAWNNRAAIRKNLTEMVPEVQQLSMKGFDAVADILRTGRARLDRNEAVQPRESALSR